MTNTTVIQSCSGSEELTDKLSGPSTTSRHAVFGASETLKFGESCLEDSLRTDSSVLLTQFAILREWDDGKPVGSFAEVTVRFRTFLGGNSRRTNHYFSSILK